MADEKKPEPLALTATVVQQGLFAPSSYEKKPPPPTLPDKRQCDMFSDMTATTKEP